MSVVSPFIYALGTSDHDGSLIIRDPLNVIRPPFIPGVFSFSIVFGMRDIEPGEHKLELLFKSPKGKTLLKTSPISLSGEKNTNHTLQKFDGFIANLNLQNIKFEEDNGEYVTEVFLNNELLDKFPIPVIRARNGE